MVYVLQKIEKRSKKIIILRKVRLKLKKLLFKK